LQTLEGHSRSVSAAAFSRDGQLLASASDDGTVRLWNPATGEPVQTLEGHSDWVSAVAFSRDGQLLASASGDVTVRLWNPATGEPVQMFNLNIVVHKLHFSSDNRCLETDRGVLRLPSSFYSVHSPNPKSLGDVFFNGNWITRNSRNLL
jgi:WD40 repeat protein